jgi:hypothetical protein
MQKNIVDFHDMLFTQISEWVNSNAFTIHKSIYAMDDLKEYKSTDKDGSETFKYYFDLHDNDSPMDTVYIVYV